MRYNIKGDTKSISDALAYLASDMNFELSKEGKEIRAEKCPKGFSLSVEKGRIAIAYATTPDFCRALSIALDADKRGALVRVRQEPSYETMGVMLDASRGAVMKTEWIKDFMRHMVRMGFNELMLYTEDTYEVDSYPYFGYMRGRYTKEELKDIVAYGNTLGIECVPCIQTLGHLDTALRWSAFADIKDQPGCLMIGEEKTYQLIEAMIQSVREVFTTDKIHAGLDEAWGVGLGNYFNKNGYKDRFTILSEHLVRVVEICKKYDFKPMMWSDMFFRLATPDGGYYSAGAKLPWNLPDLIPGGVSQVYWDYYNNSENFYDVMIREHKKMGCPIIFAGGVWTWSGPSVNNRQSIESTIPALKMCKKHGISHVFATLWGDDGAECDLYESLYGLQLFAEMNYDSDNGETKLDEMFRVCNGFDAEAFQVLDLDDFDVPTFRTDEPEFAELESYIVNTSKQVLYQNPLLGFFDKNFAMAPLHRHYEDLLARLERMDAPPKLKSMFECHKGLLKVLLSKCDIGIRLKEAYDGGDRAKLSVLSSELKTLTQDLSDLMELRKKLWYERNKPFGFEQVLVRLSGVCELTKLAYQRVDSYLAGQTDKIEELEEERLYYNSIERPHFLEYFSRKIMMTRS